MMRSKLLQPMLHVAVCLALAAPMAGGLAAPARADAQADPRSADTPEAAFERYRTLINTHDFDQLAEHVIAPNALFVFTEKSHRGMAEIEAAFNHTWSTLPDEVYSMTDPEWLAQDENTALVAFRYSYRGTLKNGQTLTGGGHGTNLYTRTTAGWRLAYEHLSHDPSPRPAAKTG